VRFDACERLDYWTTSGTQPPSDHQSGDVIHLSLGAVEGAENVGVT
jgi:hypothetical protein